LPKNTADNAYRKIPFIKIPEDGQRLVELIKQQLKKSQLGQAGLAWTKRAALVLSGGKAAGSKRKIKAGKIKPWQSLMENRYLFTPSRT
jgi:microcystin degradation protein MlrC